VRVHVRVCECAHACVCMRVCVSSVINDMYDKQQRTRQQKSNHITSRKTSARPNSFQIHFHSFILLSSLVHLVELDDALGHLGDARCSGTS
jgi:hypothetical protein